MVNHFRKKFKGGCTTIVFLGGQANFRATAEPFRANDSATWRDLIGPIQNLSYCLDIAQDRLIFWAKFSFGINLFINKSREQFIT